MKRLDIIVPHERVGEVDKILHKRNVGGMTFYDVKGRGRSKNEPIYVGTGVMKYGIEKINIIALYYYYTNNGYKRVLMYTTSYETLFILFSIKE